MKAEIRYWIAPCHFETQCDCCGCSDCPDVFKKNQKPIEKGFSGEIKEYTIEEAGYETYIDIVINQKKKINLCIDMYGREPGDSFPNKYDECDYFIVNGQLLWGDKCPKQN